MPSQPSSIRPLPPESQAQTRSSVVITSLNDVVIGLVENVLDAGATCADIRLDYVKGYCSVTDNGVGIPVAEFGTDGHLGSLHCTSKLDASRSTYGRYGRFLYHIAALSLLSIASRCGSSASAITLHRAKIVARSIGDGEYAEAIRGDHGTHVVVANLFGDIPVRYRHIAARLESISLAEAQLTLK
jgi:DNA mismatch repair protein MLH3